MKRYLYHYVWTPRYEGEGEGGEGGNNKEGESEKKFSQDDVNRMLAEDRRKHQEKLTKTREELEKLKASSTLTDEERQGLQARIDELQNIKVTKEEEAKKALEKERKEASERIKKIEEQSNRNWRLYEEEVIKGSIIQAAVDERAVSSEQLLAILRPQTRLVESMDDAGKPTGVFTAKIKLVERDGEGKSKELDLSVKDYVKRMKDSPDKFGNLFLSDTQPGLGSFNRGSSSGDSTPPKDIVEYQKWRNKNFGRT